MKFSNITNLKKDIVERLMCMKNQYSTDFKDTKCECLGFKYNLNNKTAESYKASYKRLRGYWGGEIYYSDNRVKQMRWYHNKDRQLCRKVLDEKETILHMVHPELLIEKDSGNDNIYCYLPKLKSNIKLWYVEGKLKEFGMFIDKKIFEKLKDNKKILTEDYSLHYFINTMIHQFEFNDQYITKEIKLNSSEEMNSIICNIEKIVWGNLAKIANDPSSSKLPNELTNLNKCIINKCCKTTACCEDYGCCVKNDSKVYDCCKTNDCCEDNDEKP